jgi:rod shape-determining protein MreD
MITELIKYLISFISLILLQVVLLDNIQFSGYVNPYAYTLFLLTLPVRTPKLLLLVIAFATGIIVDMFGNSVGLHASACLVLVYIRPFILNILSPRDGYETDAVPSIKVMGIKWFLMYTTLLVFVHHFILFYLEAFRFTEFITTFLRVLASTLATVSVIILIEYLFARQSGPGK